ncbi:flagellar basal body rod protein FlgB [Clostridium sp. BSD9I1]|uniref:flagellar basal body rod protein FlgB n=1 Tax=Clostridium sp. BSD9I1 TaxID=2003589 RepID=UPI0024200A9C|nr:flagellar basal body rod protein FlgB [Clostridium sp. BSD9I1]
MRISNLSQDQFTYEIIKKGLDASSERSKVIANNISNINTANYKRRYVSFEETLTQNEKELNLKISNERHFNDGASFGEITVKEDKTSSMRDDGNNVNLDLEKVNQAANTLMYNAMIAQLNNRISQKRIVISGK